MTENRAMIIEEDNDSNKGVGLILIKDECLLVGVRTDNDGVGGIGGYIKKDESALDAILRNSKEEFGIEPKNITHIGRVVSNDKKYLDTEVFLAFEYRGNINIDKNEFKCSMFVTPTQLELMKLYPPFKDSLKLLLNCYKKIKENKVDEIKFKI